MDIFNRLLTPVREPLVNLDYLLELSQQRRKIIGIFDLESTEFTSHPDFGITEVGLLFVLPEDKPFKGSRIVTAAALVDPKRPIGFRARDVTGITQKMVTGQPDFKQAWTTPFRYMFKNYMMMGFNSKSFDQHAVIKDADRHGETIALPEQHADIKTIANRLNSRRKGKLDEYASMYGVERPGDAHRALSDVYVTGGLANNLIERHGMELFLEKSDLPMDVANKLTP